MFYTVFFCFLRIIFGSDFRLPLLISIINIFDKLSLWKWPCFIYIYFTQGYYVHTDTKPYVINSKFNYVKHVVKGKSYFYHPTQWINIHHIYGRNFRHPEWNTSKIQFFNLPKKKKTYIRSKSHLVHFKARILKIYLPTPLFDIIKPWKMWKYVSTVLAPTPTLPKGVFSAVSTWDRTPFACTVS